MQRFLVDIAPVSHGRRLLLHAGYRWIQPPPPSLGGQMGLLDPLTAAGWVWSSPPPMPWNGIVDGSGMRRRRRRGSVVGSA
jgi:hypothetical protein